MTIQTAIIIWLWVAGAFVADMLADQGIKAGKLKPNQHPLGWIVLHLLWPFGITFAVIIGTIHNMRNRSK